MTNQDKKVPTTCGLSSLQRPQFSPGQLLDDDDLNAGVTYTREFTRLLFRSLFGCGVICGLQVKPQWICDKTKWSITVTKGLALDCMGNPIEVPADTTMNYGPDCQALPPSLWVTACYIEKCCRPKDVTCSQDDDAQPKPTRVRSGYEIRLYDTFPKCACHCPTKDDTATPSTANGCCGQTQEAPTPAVAPTTQPLPTPAVSICDCFKPHFEGDCECGCNCSCVILGKITVPDTMPDGKTKIAPENQVPTWDASLVRRIRPILNGYVDCGSLRFVDPNAPVRTPIVQRPGDDQEKDPQPVVEPAEVAAAPAPAAQPAPAPAGQA